MAVTTSFDDLPRVLTGADVLLDPDIVEPFGADYLAFRGRPGAVVRPRSTEQVASLLALSAERGFAVVPRAAATNLCGSFLPQPDAVVIDMTSMDRIIAIDEESLEAIAGGYQRSATGETRATRPLLVTCSRLATHFYHRRQHLDQRGRPRMHQVRRHVPSCGGAGGGASWRSSRPDAESRPRRPPGRNDRV